MQHLDTEVQKVVSLIKATTATKRKVRGLFTYIGTDLCAPSCALHDGR